LIPKRNREEPKVRSKGLLPYLVMLII